MLRRDGAVVLAALVLLSLLVWLAVLAGAGTGMDPAAMSGWWLPSAAAPAFGSGWTPARFLHVGSDDGGDDAAERVPYGAPLCSCRAASSESGTKQTRIGFHCGVCRRLYRLVDSIQPCGRPPSVD